MARRKGSVKNVRNTKRNHSNNSKKRVRFNLSSSTRKKTHSRKHRRHTISKNPRGFYKLKGGTLLPQDITNAMRGSENALENTVNVLQGKELTPSPYPTKDQPIDTNVVVI